MIKTESQPAIPAQTQEVTELPVPQMQFKPMQYKYDLAPRYNYVPISIQSGNPEFKLTGSHTEIRQFDIAPGALNLSRSFLTYEETIPTQGDDTFNWSHEDTFAAITKYELMFHRGGTHLANVDYFPQHMKMALKRQKRKAFHLEDRINGLYANNRQAKFAPRANGTDSALNYTEPRYFRAGDDDLKFVPTILQAGEYKVDGTTKAVTIETGNVGQNLKISEYGFNNDDIDNVRNVQLPLRAIADTICEVDADVDFDERLIMRVTFGPGAKVGFKTSGAASPLDPNAGTIAELDGDKPVGIKNIVLWVAYVETPEIKKILQEQVRGKGINITIPYLYSNMNSFSARKGTAMQWTLSAVNGRKLKKIESAIFDGRESKNHTFDQDNRNKKTEDGLGNVGLGYPKKVAIYHTQLGPDRLQYGDVDCTANMDWILNKRHWEDAPYATLDVYKYNWFHIDDFADTDLEQRIPNIDSGLVLDRDRIYQFQIDRKDNDDAMVLYSFATCTRLLHIQSGQKSGFV